MQPPLIPDEADGPSLGQWDDLWGEVAGSDVPYQQLLEGYLSSEIPDLPQSREEYFGREVRNLVRHAVNLRSPRCLGHMMGIVPPFVAEIQGLISRLNQNLVKMESSKSFTLLERQTLAMLHREVFGGTGESYRDRARDFDSVLGVMTSGGTTANITALWCARNRAIGPRGDFAGVREDGLAPGLEHHGCSGVVILASELAHYSIVKAAELLGLGSRQIVRIPVDSRGRLDVAALGRAVAASKAEGHRVAAIVGVAGTTDCGSIDPLAPMAEIAEAEGVHFHVDAAWGAPLLFSDIHRPMLAGIERADSVTIDGHKQFHLPLGSSLVLFRDPHLARQIEHQAEYMLRRGSRDQGRFTLEGSRAGAALFFHSALHMIGRAGYRATVEQSLRRARQFAEMIAACDDFELLLEPETNIVLYRYLPRTWRAAARRSPDDPASASAINEVNVLLQEAQFEEGHAYVSRTRLRFLPRFGREPVVALRAVLGHPGTSSDDLEALLDDQRRIAAGLGSDRGEVGANGRDPDA